MLLHLLVALTVLPVSDCFFSCCGCPAPFAASSCGQSPAISYAQPNAAYVSSQSNFQPYQRYEVPKAVHVQPVETIVAPVPHRRRIVYVYPPEEEVIGSAWDPFEPFEVQEVFVPVIRRPIYRPKPPPPPPPPKKDDCYVNDSGFKCCNGDLEKTMHGAYTALKASPTFNDCNIGLMSKVVQKATQERFRLSFETVVSLKPFGSNSRYEGNYTCRFERDGKHFMSYATPVQYDIENQKSEDTLSNADVTHDENSAGDGDMVEEAQKQEKIQKLNEGLKDVKSTGIRINERRKRAALQNKHIFIEEDAIIEFDRLNSTSRSRKFVTHEVTMGSLEPLVSNMRIKANVPVC